MSTVPEKGPASNPQSPAGTPLEVPRPDEAKTGRQGTGEPNRPPKKTFGDFELELVGDLFDDEFMTAAYAKLEAGEIWNGMDELVKGLVDRRGDSTDGEWRDFIAMCRLNPVCQLVHQDPFTRHAFKKLRGYAGDPDLLDMIYDAGQGKAPPDATPLGQEVFQFCMGAEVCRGIQDRARVVAETVDRLADTIARPQILAVAAAHLREAELTTSLQENRIGRWVAYDSDPQSLQEIQRRYSKQAVEAVGGSVGQLLNADSSLGEFDFIYSIGQFEYIEQAFGKRLVERFHEMLRPGGELLISCLADDIQFLGYMECYMDWSVICRNDRQMRDLAAGIDPEQVNRMRLSGDDTQTVLLLQVVKNAC